MGRRSRQRTTAPRSAAPARRTRRDEAPQPPWGSFPLVELAALAAIVCGVTGLAIGGRGAAILLTVAMLLGSLAGLEVAIREHFAGYRSHTLVLSGVLAVATLAVLAFAGVDRELMAIAAAAVLAGAVVVLRELFKRRSGGVGIKVR